MLVFPIVPLLFVVLVYVSKVRISTGVFSLLGLLFVSSFTVFYGGRDLYSGTDSYTYALAYESPDNASHWELGYQYWISFLNGFNPNYPFFFLASSFFGFFLFLASSTLASRVYGKELALLLFVMFSYSSVTFDLTTNGMRQGLGLSFSAFAVPLICSKKKSLGLLLMLAAAFMHNSFWLLLLFSAFWISFPRLRVPFLIVVSVLSFLFLVLVLLRVDVFSLVLKNTILPWLPDNLHRKVSAYSEFSRGFYEGLNFFGQLRIILYSLVIILLSFFVFFKSKSTFSEYGLFSISGGVLFLTIYYLMAYQAFSYRYLYLCAVFFPFVVCEWFFLIRGKFGFLNVGLYCSSVVTIVIVSFLYFVVGSDNYAGFNYWF